MSSERQMKVAIAGAGPAGSSLAIRLANAGFETVLIERKRFPRQKLCGEFISPECLAHFEKLGLLDEMLDAGGDRVFETRFFEIGGRSVTVPTGWLGGSGFALSLSRAEMDHRLLKRARSAGAEVVEDHAVSGVEMENGRVASLCVRSSDGATADIPADVFVDATGRAGVLAKLAARSGDGPASPAGKPAFVGFKAHVDNARIGSGVCEIYSFEGGYGGLSNVENRAANLCFLIRSEAVRASGGDAAEMIERFVLRNQRAAQTLRDISPRGEWLAVAIDGFGTKLPAPAANLLTIGDAASFIDPFTGSGMVMALESSEVLAGCFDRSRPDRIAVDYADRYRATFSRRLRVCSLLRRTAFMPTLATVIVSSLAFSSRASRFLARSTRR